MVVFAIPELLEQVAIHLSLQDLARCARVSRAWNAFFTPFVWHTVPEPPHPGDQKSPILAMDKWREFCRKDLFKRLVQEDLLLDSQQQQQQLENEEGAHHYPAGDNDHSLSASLLSSFHCIRTLDIRHFSLSSKSPWSTPSTNREEEDATDSATAPQPTSEDFTLYLLYRCVNLQTLRISTIYLSYPGTQRQRRFWNRVVCGGLPESLKELVLSFPSTLPFARSPVVPLLFSRCPMGLQKMSLVYAYRDLSVPYNTAINFTDIRDDGDIEQEDEEVVDDYKDEAPLPAMKELRVTGMGTNDPHPPTWSRFFKRCEHLRALHVSSIDQSWVQALAECRTVERLTLVVADIEILRLLTTALRTGLPSLNELCIEDLHASDEALASVLSVCRAGWRSIELPTINSCSVDALIEHHCPTLEVIKVLTVPEISSTQMVQILASSPRLHTFVMFDEEFIFDPKEPHFEADDFIDLDHSTGQLRPWLCESTLKEFRAHVTGIPRPDLNRTFHGHPLGEGMVMPESFPGQGRELQRRVYGRLARFTSLETLMLGNEDRNFDNTSRYVESEMTIEEEDDEDHQYTCLEMSLSSGLQALGSLKKLRELRIMRMATAIGVEEVQWMVQSWPRLKKLSGLNYSAEASVQAASWMRERCPRIAVNMCKRGVTIE